MPTKINSSDTSRETATPSAINKSRTTVWVGGFLSGGPALFLALDGVMKLFKPAIVVQSTIQLGYPESSIVALGVVLLISTILYAVPRTAVLGAVLLTGYLGGAVATHVRVSDSWSNILFPVVFGAMLWGGLWFRNPRVRQLPPFVEV